MKKIAGLLALVVALVMTASCTSFKLEGIQVTKDLPSYQAVGTFEVSVKIHEFLGQSAGLNLFNVSSDAMNTVIYDTIQREIAKASADAAVSVSVTYQASFVDMILNGLTSALYAPATATIKGTLVKYSK